MAQVGMVKEITGVVQAVAEDGSTKILVLGDAINSNDVILTIGSGSTVKLSFENGRELSLQANEKALMDESVFSNKDFDNADVQAQQNALLAGGDLPTDETAAGLTTPNADGGFTQAYIAERTDARVDIDTYNLTTQGRAATTFEGADEALNEAPDAIDDVGISIEEGDGSEGQYEAPSQAIGNVLDNDIDDGLPNPDADLDVVNLSSQNTANTYIVNGDGNFVLDGEFGTLVLNPETGDYTYTIDDENPEVDALNISDTLAEVFTYTISDGLLEDSANLSITIEGRNDAPIAYDDFTSGNDNDLTVVQGEIVPKGLYVGEEYDDDMGQDIPPFPNFDENAPGVSIDQWGFYHNGGSLSIDVLTEDGYENWIDINGDLSQSFLDSMIHLYRVDESGNMIEYIDGDDDGGLGNDGSVSDLDSLLDFDNLAAGEYILEISAYHFDEDEIGQEFQDDNTTSSGEFEQFEEEYNIGHYQITFDGDVLITSVPELGKIISQYSDSINANNAIEEGLAGIEEHYDAPIIAVGNVLINDTDVDNVDYGDDAIDYELSVVDVRSNSVENSASQEEGSFSIEGVYGTLLINADGTYVYTANNENEELNSLNEGDTRTDAFTYTVSDNEEFGAKTDTAVLTITIEGKNDAPIAIAEINTMATEEGSGNETSITDAPIVAVGNVLINDTDVDNVDYSDDAIDYELSVVGITSLDSSHSAIEDDGEFSIQGAYGTLVINTDGTYIYTVDDTNTAVNALNVGDTLMERFNYNISDNEAQNPKMAEAILSIVVNGANDAPIAFTDSAHSDVIIEGVDISGIGSGAAAVDENAEAEVDFVEQTLNFGQEYANQSVQISFDASINGSWNGVKFFSLPEVDSFKVFINGERVDSLTYDSGESNPEVSQNDADNFSQTQSFVYVVSLDENGNALLRFEVESTSTEESVDISNIVGNILQYTAIEEGLGSEFDGNVIIPDEVGVSAVGNVLYNDTDVDNVDYSDNQTDYELSVIDVDGSSVSEDTQIMGLYGVLSISANGDFQYIIDETNEVVNALNEGDWLSESFTYTLSDNEVTGAKTDTADLNIMIQGTNDAPVANVDVNSVKEQGVGIFPEAEVLRDDADSAPMIAKGNVLKNDTDVDNTDASDLGFQHAGHDDMTLFTIWNEGADTFHDFTIDDELHSPDLVEGIVPKTNPITGEIENYTEYYLPTEYGAEGEYIFETKHETSIEGVYGTLYIGKNGGYDYILNDSLDVVQALNEDSEALYEVFHYTVSDNQEGNEKIDTSTLTIRIDGTNDAPVANADSITKLSDALFVHQGTGQAWDYDNIDVASEYGVPVLSDGATLGVATTVYQTYWFFGLHTRVIADNTEHLDGKGANETIGFNFNEALDSVSVELSHFNGLNIVPDVASWTVYGENGEMESGTFSGNGFNVSFDIDPSIEFTRLEISANERYSDFRIKAIDGYGIEENSFIIDKEFLLSNDTDVDNETLSIGTLGGADAAYLSINADGNIVFTPGDDFDASSLSFTYTASDGMAESNVVEVNVDFEKGTISSGSEIHTYNLVTGEQIIGSDGYDVLIVPESETFDLSKVSDIEQIDLSNGAHELNITAQEVFNATDDNNTLIINGENTNAFNPSDWNDMGTEDGYHIFKGSYDGTNNVTLLVDEDISVII